MTRNFFNEVNKMFDTFDRIHSATNSVAQYVNSFPRANIVQTDDGKGVRVELAVPGFCKSEIGATFEDGILNVFSTEKREETPADEKFVAKGLSTKPFTKSLYLGDMFEFAEAYTERGLVCFDFMRKQQKEALEEFNRLMIK